MGSTKDDDWETSIFFDGKVGNQLELRFLEFPNHMIGEQLQKIELEHTLGPKTLGSLYPFHQFDPSLQGSQCQKGPQTTRLVEMGGAVLGKSTSPKNGDELHDQVGGFSQIFLEFQPGVWSAKLSSIVSPLAGDQIEQCSS